MVSRLKKLHADEGGLQTLEVVAILAVAAIVLAVIKTFWTSIKNWFTSSNESMQSDWNEETGGGANP